MESAIRTINDNQSRGRRGVYITGKEQMSTKFALDEEKTRL